MHNQYEFKTQNTQASSVTYCQVIPWQNVCLQKQPWLFFSYEASCFENILDLKFTPELVRTIYCLRSGGKTVESFIHSFFFSPSLFLLWYLLSCCIFTRTKLDQKCFTAVTFVLKLLNLHFSTLIEFKIDFCSFMMADLFSTQLRLYQRHNIATLWPFPCQMFRSDAFFSSTSLGFYS